MDIEARLQAIDDALLDEQDAAAAADALVDEATSPALRFAIDARLAALFDAAGVDARALRHAEQATANVDGARTAGRPDLLASALDLQAAQAVDAVALERLVHRAEDWARTWPIVLNPCVMKLRKRLALKLPAAEAEANARAMVVLAEPEEMRGWQAESQVTLARVLANSGSREEAVVWARRAVDAGLSEWAVEALGLLAELEPDDENHAAGGLTMARELDAQPEETVAAAWTILVGTREPRVDKGRTDDIVRMASFGPVDDPTTFGADGAPTRGGLASERVFGPLRELTCRCGKYAGLRFYRVVCEVCGVEVRTPRLRAWRFGHISLRTPVLHPRWARTLAERWRVSRTVLVRMALKDDYPSGYDAWEEEQREYATLRGPETVAAKRDALHAVRLETLSVLPPESTLSHAPLRAAYEALLAANHGAGPLQPALDALFRVIDRVCG